mmetsp:Transcript_121215/g.387257  ORF Transcript_121215/g.387257 Transcript_121215/m.387257 type:complete len:266 (-) Transcript_121215:1354-2151(-)
MQCDQVPIRVVQHQKCRAEVPHGTAICEPTEACYAVSVRRQSDAQADSRTGGGKFLYLHRRDAQPPNSHSLADKLSSRHLRTDVSCPWLVHSACPSMDSGHLGRSGPCTPAGAAGPAARGRANHMHPEGNHPDLHSAPARYRPCSPAAGRTSGRTYCHRPSAGPSACDLEVASPAWRTWAQSAPSTYLHTWTGCSRCRTEPRPALGTASEGRHNAHARRAKPRPWAQRRGRRAKCWAGRRGSSGQGGPGPSCFPSEEAFQTCRPV